MKDLARRDKMGTNTRILVILASIFAVTAALFFVVVQILSNSILTDVTKSFVANEASHVIKDTVEPVNAEIRLVEELAQNPAVIAWARQPDDTRLTDAAFVVLNEYRQRFDNKSYFAALVANLGYYYNDQQNSFTGNELQLKLNSDNPVDAWFFASINSDDRSTANAGLDEISGSPRLWINGQVVDGNEVLGLVGTSYDLSEFISKHNFVGVNGVVTLFTDKDGAIVLSPNKDNIVIGALGLDKEEKKTFFDSLTNLQQRQNLLDAFDDVSSSIGVNDVVVDLMLDNTRMFVGVHYHPGIDWYQLTLIDAQKLLPISTFNNLFALFALLFVAAIVSLYLGLNRYVVTPLKILEKHVLYFRKSRKILDSKDAFPGEFAAFYSAFDRLATEILNHEKNLEAKIEQRTHALMKSEKMASIGVVASGVANEVKSPLGFIGSNLGIMQDYMHSIKPHIETRIEQLSDEPSAANNRSISELQFILDDLDEIFTESLQSFERIKNIMSGIEGLAYKSDTQAEQFSLNDCVSLAIDSMGLGKGDPIEVKVKLWDSLPSVLMDPKKITESLVNIIDNSLKAVQRVDNPLIEITTGIEGSSLFVKIADNGCGISEKDQKQLFTPFYSTRPVGEGKGLSLSVAQGVMKSHSGYIELSSDPGTGTIVRFVFDQVVQLPVKADESEVY